MTRARYSAEELSEARRALASLLAKCVKAQKTLRKGTPQHTLTKNRVKALRIAVALLKKAS